MRSWADATIDLALQSGLRSRGGASFPTGKKWQTVRGRYRFRYLLDGERWENDWAADAYVPNEYGGNDSVVDLAAGLVSDVHAQAPAST